ncbi:hypothetical protein ACHAPE_002065 [Trichoderma viride]
MEESIQHFTDITGASVDVARGFLEITGGDYQRAIELFFESPDLVGAGVSSNPPTASTSRPPVPRRTNIGREDASGVIHIPSDDEDEDDVDMQFNDDDAFDPDQDERVAAAQAAAYAQEEEDAAMAKRLQEELYQESGPAGGDVRAPIARTTETLVAPDPSWGEEESSAILDQLRRRRQMPLSSRGPFGHRIWGDETRRAEPAVDDDTTSAHARRLEDLFRPPYDLMSRLSWDEARTLGKEDKKWIMVNLQDMSDFGCQMLNRDIWKDRAVKELVNENFIFLQLDKEYPDAEEYITFYFPNRSHENPDNYPHVSIVDPRTGEQVKVWSGKPFPDANEFHAEVAEFLDRYSLAANSKNPVARAQTKKPQVIDVDRMTEDEMLEMALKNSLAGAQSGASGSGSGSTPSVLDPDALTKEEAKKAEEEELQSPFAQISSVNPHVEPDNNPSTTTRIQFRHPDGRIIRRFNLQDSVRRIYEWLKAEPLQGKEGIPFELKQMPQGQDLIESLDSTIEEAGLKQGTVMIELITDE